MTLENALGKKSFIVLDWILLIDGVNFLFVVYYKNTYNQFQHKKTSTPTCCTYTDSASMF